MDSKRPSDNQRQSFRCRTPVGQSAEFRLNGARYNAQILDESAGGFAIGVEGLESVEEGCKAILRTAVGYFEVQVANVSPLPVQHDRRGDVSAALRVGLKRLREIDPPEAAYRGPTLLARLMATIVPRQAPVIGSFLLLGVLLVGGAAASSVWIMHMGWHGNFRYSQSATSVRQSATGWGSQGTGPARAFPVAAPRTTGFSARDASHTETRYQEKASGQRGLEAAAAHPSLGKLLARTHGATVFAIPEVIRQLQLTDSQQAEIEHISQRAAQRIQGLQKEAVKTSRQEIDEREGRLLDDAQHDAMQVLSQEQRTAWKRLTDNSIRQQDIQE